MSDCFIVMPITTPSSMIESYGNDADHFQHVLDHLFIPAVAAAGFNPVSPVAQGSDVIHAEIIRQLESSPMVLCDMSTLNPNVFFELGIRTAVNKPVCNVRDLLTPTIPFDTRFVNYHTYDHSLSPWKLQKEIEQLSDHLRKSFDRSNGTNTLWKYFGISGQATLELSESPIEAKLDVILSRLESTDENRQPTVWTAALDDDAVDNLIDIIEKQLTLRGGKLLSYTAGPNTVRAFYTGTELPTSALDYLKKKAAAAGRRLELILIQDF